ncbi:MAG: ring-1,2-phenylacetyl-CoA epoxidase subunit PaaC [Arenicella sp.]|jgi:ring-1,2-phenylacetyl-CoA epoxidase subunit PaaC
MKNSNIALIDYVTGLGDDSLILGQRLSEWCSNGPFLEEDLALANVALDFLGRAQMFYDYAAELHNASSSADPITADDIAYLRDAREYKNTLIHELPIGDFAYTMARQFLIDCFGLQLMTELCKSADKSLAGIAAKAIKECRYHLRRSNDWVLRLGDGTGESHERVQNAFDQLWGYTAELFEMTDSETELLTENISVDKVQLKDAWLKQVKDTLAEATLDLPSDEWAISGGRAGIHTEHLGQILAELQYLQRAYPGLTW